MNEPKTTAEIPQRVIATTPSTAEILFDLGLDEHVVGVCRFCKYPPQVENLPRIGGLLDRDDEAILRLEPDLVIELEENVQSCEKLRSFGIDVLTVNHKTVEGVLDSFLTIGQKFGPDVFQRAQERQAELRKQLAEIERKSRREKPVRVLICVDRERGTGQLLSLYIAGKNPFYQRTLEIAGGVNVAENATLPVPVVSVEEILRMNPEVIIDLCTIPSASDVTQGIADWNVLGDTVDAVRNGRIYVLTEDYTSIPGPRLILYVEKIAEILSER
ncbi:MAG: helical backbone metal receptor [Planctomycetaceae bacterium]|nr:helical backbone metal receptor [Planctomycetaceae bacterium]